MKEGGKERERERVREREIERENFGITNLAKIL